MSQNESYEAYQKFDPSQLYQPGNSNQNAGSGCGKALGMGCGVLVLLVFLASVALSTGPAGFLAVITIIVIVGLAIGRWKKKDEQALLKRVDGRGTEIAKSAQAPNPGSSSPRATNSTNAVAQLADRDSGMYSRSSENLVGAASTATSAGQDGVFTSPFCIHRFTVEQLDQSAKQICDCGFTYLSSDLRKYAQLESQRKKIDDDLFALKSKMRASLSEHVSRRENSQVAAMQAAKSAPAIEPKVAKPKVAKPKVNISLQQWLIVGASVLVLVAGSVFVSTNIDSLDQWVFELITIGISVATGFGSLKARSISVLLANFLAAFSASMQLATMSIIGDQISPDFIWSDMPAWWWAVSLVVVSATSTLLAKLGKNFGFKSIAVLTSSAAALVINIGLLRDIVSAEAGAYFVAVASATSVGVVMQNRYLRGIEQPTTTDKALKLYLADLAKREDNSLRIFGIFSAALQHLVAIGLVLMAFASVLDSTIDSLSLLVLAFAWVGISTLAKPLSSQLTDKFDADRVRTTANAVTYVTVNLSVISLVANLESLWLVIVLSNLVMAGIIFANKFAKSYQASDSVVTAALFVSAVAALFWSQLFSRAELVSAEFGTFLILFALVLTVADWRIEQNRYNWAAQALHIVGVFILAQKLLGNSQLDYDSLAYALIGAGFALAMNLHFIARVWLSKQQSIELDRRPLWMAFGAACALIIVMQTPLELNPTSASISSHLTLVFVFMGYAVAAQLLATFTKLKTNFTTLLTSHYYLGQFVTVLAIFMSMATVGSMQAPLYALLIGLLAVINYAFGVLQRKSVTMQVGYVAALGAFFTFLWSIETASLAGIFALQVAFVAASAWGHSWLLRKHSNASPKSINFTPASAVGGSLIVGYAVSADLWNSATTNDLWISIGILGALAVTASELSQNPKVAKVASRASALKLIGFIYAGFGVLSNVLITQDEIFEVSRWRLIVTCLVLGAVAVRQNQKSRHPLFVGLAYFSSVTSGWALSELWQRAFATGFAPEPFSVCISAAVIGTTLLLGLKRTVLRRILLIDFPIVATAINSIVYGATVGAFLESTDEWQSYLRVILGFASISALSYVRILGIGNLAWTLFGYVSSVATAIRLAALIHQKVWPDYIGLEIYLVVISGAYLLTTWFALKSRKKNAAKKQAKPLAALRQLMMVDAPLLFNGFVIAAFGVTVTAGLSVEAESWTGYLRQLVGFGLISVVAFLRLRRSDSLAWIIGAYVSSVAAAISAATWLSTEALSSFQGPEIYSLLITASVLAAHRVTLPKLKLKGTLFSWGLPLATAILPSTFFTYTSLDVPFSELQPLEITRVIAVLVVAITLLVLGVRRGNLANAAMGIAGLTLLVIPNTAMHSNDVVPDSQVESTALVIGVLLFGLLALLKRNKLVSGNSLIFLGLPITIALAPALVKSLIALGNPELTTVDWWRFSIVLAAGLTLLIVGSLREVAGLFYPGLVSVLLSALPYGFKQTSSNEWFLWVLLLLVAGVMVWVAVRLEKMKKAGRSSTSWLKELK